MGQKSWDGTCGYDPTPLIKMTINVLFWAKFQRYLLQHYNLYHDYQ